MNLSHSLSFAPFYLYSCPQKIFVPNGGGFFESELLFLGSTDRVEIGPSFYLSRVAGEAFEETNLCGRLLSAGNSRFLLCGVVFFSVFTLFLYLLSGNETQKRKRAHQIKEQMFGCRARGEEKENPSTEKPSSESQKRSLKCLKFK